MHATPYYYCYYYFRLAISLLILPPFSQATLPTPDWRFTDHASAAAHYYAVTTESHHYSRLSPPPPPTFHDYYADFHWLRHTLSYFDFHYYCCRFLTPYFIFITDWLFFSDYLPLMRRLIYFDYFHFFHYFRLFTPCHCRCRDWCHAFHFAGCHYRFSFSSLLFRRRFYFRLCFRYDWLFRLISFHFFFSIISLFWCHFISFFAFIISSCHIYFISLLTLPFHLFSAYAITLYADAWCHFAFIFWCWCWCHCFRWFHFRCRHSMPFLFHIFFISD